MKINALKRQIDTRDVVKRGENAVKKWKIFY